MSIIEKYKKAVKEGEKNLTAKELKELKELKDLMEFGQKDSHYNAAPRKILGRTVQFNQPK